MLRNELREMIELAERLAAAEEPATLATLFSSSGSTYRPLGSMMISGPGTMIAGGVSGGCLEEHVARRGRALTQERAAALMTFDTDPEADGGDKLVLGCGGSIEILVERMTSDHLIFLRQMYAATSADAPSTAACLIDSSAAPSLTVARYWLADARCHAMDPQLRRLCEHSANKAKSRHVVLGKSRRALICCVPPMTRLAIFGAGDDARPLCALAHALGWHVTVADHRSRLATQSRFPGAERVVAADWKTAMAGIKVTPRTALVVMTHSLADDMEILPLLADVPAAYVGVLGAEHRRRWLLGSIAETQDLSEAFAARVRGPIGLNLGDRSAPGIATAVVAEILAELNGCPATPLSQTACALPHREPAEAVATHA